MSSISKHHLLGLDGNNSHDGVLRVTTVTTITTVTTYYIRVVAVDMYLHYVSDTLLLPRQVWRTWLMTGCRTTGISVMLSRHTSFSAISTATYAKHSQTQPCKVHKQSSWIHCKGKHRSMCNIAYSTTKLVAYCINGL